LILQLGDESPERQFVAVHAEADDPTKGSRGKHRVPTLGLAGVDVRDVHLDVGYRHADEGIAEGEVEQVGGGVVGADGFAAG